MAALQAAFTRTDLIALVCIVSLLSFISVSALANADRRSEASVCGWNVRRLAQAWLAFAYDHDERLVPNYHTTSLSDSNRTWAVSRLDFNGGFPEGGNTNTLFLTQLSPLAPYLGRQASVFRCPSDPSLSYGTNGLPRVRSYSMNPYLGEGADNNWGPGCRTFTKLSELVRPTPSQAFVFIEEREESINDAKFFVSMSGYQPRDPSRYQLVDFPADWHTRSAHLSFADGHLERWHWRDDRTTPRHRRGVSIGFSFSSPGNPDIARLQSASTSSINPPSQ